jgi:hypothetical protein
MQSISRNQYAVFKLRHVNHYSYETIAYIMQESINEVMQSDIDVLKAIKERNSHPDDNVIDHSYYAVRKSEYMTTWTSAPEKIIINKH